MANSAAEADKENSETDLGESDDEQEQALNKSGPWVDGYLPFSSTLREGPDKQIDAAMSNSVADISKAMERSSMAWTLSSIKIDKCEPGEGETVLSYHAFARWKDTLLSTFEPIPFISESEKWNVFKRTAGAALLDVLEGLEVAKVSATSITPFSDAMKTLEAYFNSDSNKKLAKLNFRQAKQAQGESNQAYLNKMVKLVKHCGFDVAEQENELMMTVATNTTDNEVRRQALRVGCSYIDLRQFVSSLELINSLEKKNKPKAVVQTLEVQAVSTSTGRTNRPFNSRGGTSGQRSDRQGRFPPPKGRGDKLECNRCGSKFHTSQSCPHSDKSCNNCGRIGHFARKCYTSAKRSIQNIQRDNKEGKPEEPAPKIPKNEEANEISQVGDSDEY